MRGGTPTQHGFAAKTRLLPCPQTKRTIYPCTCLGTDGSSHKARPPETPPLTPASNHTPRPQHTQSNRNRGAPEQRQPPTAAFRSQIKNRTGLPATNTTRRVTPKTEGAGEAGLYYLVAGRGGVLLAVRVIIHERLHELRQPAVFHHEQLRVGPLLRATHER